MNKLKVAVIGLGFAGSVHTDAYASYLDVPEKAQLVALCDRDEEKLKMMANCYGTKAYTDYKEMFEKEDLDIVDICLPHHLHAQVAVDAAKAGINIICEKPIATTPADADKMIAAAKKAGVKLMVAEDQVHLPAHKLAKELIDKGALGKIFMTRILSAVYDMPASAKGEWKLDPRNKGMLLDMAVHYFLVLQWIMGKIESVTAMAESVVIKKGKSEFDDNAITIVKFKNGAIGEVSVTTAVIREPTNRLEFYGTEGSLIIDQSCPQPLKYHSLHPGMRTESWVTPEVEHETYPGYYRIAFGNEVKYFVDCVRENRQPEFSGKVGKEALKVVQAAYKSVKTGKTQIVE
jgi:predicted dehydrogenase